MNKYVTGIVREGKRNVGVSLFDPESKKVEIIGIGNAKKRFMNEEPIIGFKHVKRYVNTDSLECCIRDYPQLSTENYNTSKLPIIDCQGNVVKPGKDVCIGTVGINQDKKYIVVNTKGKTSFLSKEEVLKQRPVGITGKTEVAVIRVCENFYMSEEEFLN